MIGKPAVLALAMLLAGGVERPAYAQVSWAKEAERWTQATPGSGLLSWVRQGPHVDFDADGVVGFSDFLLFAQSYGSGADDSTFDIRMDLNVDGRIDFSDFLSFGVAYSGQSDDGPPPEGLTLYVTDFGEGSLTSMDTRTHLITDYITFRGPSSVSIASDGQTIYVSEAFGLFAIDPGHQALFSVPTASHGRIAQSPDEQTLYLTQEMTDQLLKIDIAAQEVVDTVAVGDMPVDVGITPDGRRLYVANSEGRDITVVDVATMSAVARIDLGSRPWEIVIAPDGKRAFVSDPDRGVISVVDLTTNLVAGGIALNGAFARGMVLSPDGNTLYVASETSLVAIDVERNLVSRSLELADDTSTIGVTPDGTLIYVATLLFSKGGTGLSVVDAASWRVLGRIRGFLFPSEIQFLPLSSSSTSR